MRAERQAKRGVAPTSPPDLSSIRATGRVLAGSWLSQDLLLLLWALPGASRVPRAVWLVGTNQLQIDVREVAEMPHALTDEEHEPVSIVLAHCPREAISRPGLGTLVVKAGRSWIRLEPGELGEAIVALEVLLAGRLARAEPDDRAELIELLAAAVAGEERYSRELSESLFRIRETLRLRLPESEVDRARPTAGHVDAIRAIDNRAFYVEGWIRHEGADLVALTAVSPEGHRIELADSAFRYARRDVTEFYENTTEARLEKLGFIAYFELETPSLRPDGWLLELRDSHGSAVQTAMPTVLTELKPTRTTILADLALERPPDERLRVDHILPAIARVQLRLAASAEIDTVDQLGVAPPDPDISIVVPLYRRVDFLEHQLAQFAHDPAIAGTDLVYVLDSPADAEYLRSFATQLYRLYGIPFRLATLTRNGGFSVVNNLGASLARGRVLLLLNSDVLPEAPGWLDALVRFHDANPQLGALAPKLLYEDDSIQHAGLYFDRPPGAHVWSNEHYFKGMHRDLPAANVARPVPAVTAACMMIATDLYRQQGGLRGAYVQGDYEDTDLCLRLDEAGYECWYLPEVALYHLEGQSYPSSDRELASEYNKWLHSYLWREKLAAVSERFAETPVPRSR